MTWENAEAVHVGLAMKQSFAIAKPAMTEMNTRESAAVARALCV